MSLNARSGFLKFFDVNVTARDFARVIGFGSREETGPAIDE